MIVWYFEAVIFRAIAIKVMTKVRYWQRSDHRACLRRDGFVRNDGCDALLLRVPVKA